MDQQENVKWYLKIADYFQYICKDNHRATEAVAVQLQNAGAKKRLLDYMRNDHRPRRMQNVWKNKFYKVRCLERKGRPNLRLSVERGIQWHWLLNDRKGGYPPMVMQVMDCIVATRGTLTCFQFNPFELHHYSTWGSDLQLLGSVYSRFIASEQFKIYHWRNNNCIFSSQVSSMWSNNPQNTKPKRGSLPVSDVWDEEPRAWSTCRSQQECLCHLWSACPIILAGITTCCLIVSAP